MKKLTMADRLGLVGYRNQGITDAEPHITVNTDICNTGCDHKGTSYACPANCYTIDEKGDVHFQFEDCIECGTCMFVCDKSAVTWNYPHPEKGRGITWNHG